MLMNADGRKWRGNQGLDARYGFAYRYAQNPYARMASEYKTFGGFCDEIDEHWTRKLMMMDLADTLAGELKNCLLVHEHVFCSAWWYNVS
jgi:hypothetical protein